ncbi:MAG TPA: phosphoribosyltransferase family protein [Bacteroidales bacterium]|nr:phosphoribosyltransferase family protein [Bacteroidales bacterium]HPT20678.1 phosphoribosyltransferase family protein [Bacteroidales bacterium]
MNYICDLWDDFVSLLFPRLCYGCGEHLLRNENLICTECYVAIPRTNYHLVGENPVEQLFWGRCFLEKAAAFSFYNKGSRIRNLIHNLKYKGIKEIGYELGRIYGRSLKSSGFTSGIDLIIPVPLHPDKKRKRGFNQSECISTGISEVTGLPVDTSSLIRIKASATQTKRSRYDRWTNVDGIFQVSDPYSVRGRHILLVDDVITTGSTIEACAVELLTVKGVKVSAVALAFAAI